jgi:hypothetical protein
MCFDTTAAAVALHGVGALAGSPAEAVTRVYRDSLHDMWNWHDLHVGPSGLGCGGAELSGSVLVGTPFVNAHYARQLQVWAVQVAAVGQQWDASSRRLALSPPTLSPGDRLPWFTPDAAGTIELLSRRGVSAPPVGVRVAVSSGRLHAQEVSVVLRLPACEGPPPTCIVAGSLKFIDAVVGGAVDVTLT